MPTVESPMLRFAVSVPRTYPRPDRTALSPQLLWILGPVLSLNHTLPKSNNFSTQKPKRLIRDDRGMPTLIHYPSSLPTYPLPTGLLRSQSTSTVLSLATCRVGHSSTGSSLPFPGRTHAPTLKKASPPEVNREPDYARERYSKESHYTVYSYPRHWE